MTLTVPVGGLTSLLCAPPEDSPGRCPEGRGGGRIGPGEEQTPMSGLWTRKQEGHGGDLTA